MQRKTNSGYFIFLLFGMLMLAGCASMPVKVSTNIPITATLTVEGMSMRSTERAGTVIAIQKTAVFPTVTPQPSVTPVPPTETPTPQNIAAPAGLLYCSGLLRYVQPDNQTVTIAPCDASISPNKHFAIYKNSWNNVDDIWYLNLATGDDINITRNADTASETSPVYINNLLWGADSQHIYFSQGGDYWLQDIWKLDVATGEKRNLTNTPTRDETIIQVWLAQKQLIFYSYAKDDEVGPYRAGHLTTAQLDGSNYKIRLDELDWVPPAISPNGQSLALMGGRLYESKMGLQQIAFKTQGIAPSIRATLVAPAWSPDGRQIGWSIYAEQEGQTYSGMGLFDIEKGNLQVLHLYSSYMGEGYPPPPIWSPDGKWLALKTCDNNTEKDGLWIIRADGGEEHHLGDYFNPIWSPDGQAIAIQQANETGSGIWVAKIGNWKPERTDLPQNAEVKDWLDPQTISGWSNMTFLSPEADNPYTVTEAGTNLNVREEPSTKARIIEQLHAGDQFVLLGYPVFKEQYAWWQVRIEKLGIEGWIIENHTWHELTR